jgi:hypothetical protein
MPADAQLSLPGLASIGDSSPKVFTGRLGVATITTGRS